MLLLWGIKLKLQYMKKAIIFLSALLVILSILYFYIEETKPLPKAKRASVIKNRKDAIYPFDNKGRIKIVKHYSSAKQLLDEKYDEWRCAHNWRNWADVPNKLQQMMIAAANYENFKDPIKF